MSRHPCSGCSADLEWSPGAGVLECPYCGTRTEIETEESPASADGIPKAIVEFLDKDCSATAKKDCTAGVSIRGKHHQGKVNLPFPVSV